MEPQVPGMRQRRQRAAQASARPEAVALWP